MGADFRFVLQDEVQLIDTSRQAENRERVEWEFKGSIIPNRQLTLADVNAHAAVRMPVQILDNVIFSSDRDETVLERIVAEYIGKTAADNSPKPKIEQRPRCVLTGRSAAEITPGYLHMLAVCLVVT